MPTKKPRLTVTFEPEDYELITAIAKHQGDSKGSVVSSMVTLVRPYMERLVGSAEAFERMSVAEKKAFISRLENLETEIQGALDLV